MKITITGSLGNISKPLAEILIKNGHEVTIISSDPKKADDITALGAKPAIGSVSDVAFLTDAFTGADAIYTMVPPNFGAPHIRQYMAQTGKNYQEAIKAAGVKRVVNLSSIGAHLPEGTGPITGLYDVEQTLNSLDGVAVKHLRAGIFYINFFFDIGLIKNMGIMGNNYGEKTKLVMVHPRDIAVIAAQELQTPFEGKSHQYVVSDEQEMTEVVKTLGTAIGKPALPWVQFSDAEAFAGMTAAGMPEAIAAAYVEMGNAINSGKLYEDFKPTTWGNTKLADFAKEFAAVYAAQG
ncbi:NAD(P)H-binding protein [Chitinophaga sp. SYP-B3965]|uniref:NAD(P)H-binding protein n=1 Tax=Chitinophaga sp. SYP-B3965 TaxID=2663120 RepID=UPI001299C41F|nr:NAD(P)H-binding protein [Chitinophaga sp. SYP-B3965]MRG44376.1 NAD(P)H-binding protein [Chitinophaga sp. SYP-B3965]